jgi:hypothetical protein
MTINMKKVLGALTLLSMGAVANAASVSLIPLTDTQNVGIGDVVTMQIDIDFSAEGGTLGGGFDLTFDESQLGLLGFTPTVILGDPAFGRPPDYVPGSGLLESWGVGDFAGLTTGTVGEVSFEVLAGATSSLVSLGPTAGIAGPWVSAVDFITIIDPVYNEVAVVVPVPAAVWFMLSGLGALVGFGRRKAA